MEELHKCKHCNKSFTQVGSKNRHEATCLEKTQKKQQALTCSHCDKQFSTASNKLKHETKQICQNGQTNINEQHAGHDIHNTTNNNHTIQGDVNIILNLKAFGQENVRDLSNLYNAKNKAFVETCIMQALPGILQMIEHRYFNEDYPENHNIRKDNKKDHLMKVYDGKKWRYRMSEEIIKDVIEHTTITTDDLIDKLLYGDDYDDSTIEKLGGYEREYFIERIQGYLRVLKAAGLDNKIDDVTWREKYKDSLTKQKLFQVVD